MIYSYQITHNKETNDFNGDNAQQFIITLGTNAQAGDVEGILEQLLEKIINERTINDIKRELEESAL